MRPRSVVACLAAAALALPAGPAAAATSARTIRVASVSALTAAVAAARPGDHIELARGSYALRAPLEIKAAGIVLTGNAAAITGTAGVRVSGSDVTVTGLAFGTADTIEIKAGARHVRLTRNTFRLAARAVNWLSVAGDDAEIDHNEFAGKRTAGVFLQVTGPGSTGMAQRTWVHHNYFADHTFGGRQRRRGAAARRQHPAARDRPRGRRGQPLRTRERRPGGHLGQVVGERDPAQHHPEQHRHDHAAARQRQHGGQQPADRRHHRHPDLRQRPDRRQQHRPGQRAQPIHRGGQRRHARRHPQLDRARGGRPGAGGVQHGGGAFGRGHRAGRGRRRRRRPSGHHHGGRQRPGRRAPVDAVRTWHPDQLARQRRVRRGDRGADRLQDHRPETGPGCLRRVPAGGPAARSWARRSDRSRKSSAT